MTRILPKQQEETAEQRAARHHRAFVLSTILATLITTLTLYNIFILIQNGQSIQLSLIVGTVTMGATFISAFLARRDQAVIGISILIIMFSVANFVGVARSTHFGLIYCPLAFIWLSTLVIQTFPSYQIGHTIVIIALINVFLIALDLFWPVPRPSISAHLQPAILIVAAAIILTFTFSIARQFIFFDLRTKFITIFLALTLIPLIVLTAADNYAGHAVLVAEATYRLTTTATQTAGFIDNVMNNIQAVIRTEANVPDIVTYLTMPPDERPNSETETAVLTLLNGYRDKDPVHILLYTLIDETGQPILDSLGNRGQEAGASATADPSFATPMATGLLYMGPVLFSPDTNDPYFYVSSPIFDPNGRILGVFRVKHHADYFQLLLTINPNINDDQSFAILLDENHLSLAHSAAPDTRYKLMASSDLAEIERLQAGGRLPHSFEEDISLNLPELAQQLDDSQDQPTFKAHNPNSGILYNQVVVAPLQALPWQIAVFQPEHIFLQLATQQTRNTSLLALVISGIVAIITVVLSHRLVTPIIRLTEVATALSKGDLTARATIETHDEIGALAQTFNQMAVQLQQTLTGLETRIAERTQALEISTQVSRQLSMILDQRTLVTEVVKLIGEAFNYYHVHIFITDKATGNHRLVAGTGQAGEKMLATNHFIPQGEGLVGQAAETNTVILVPDVSQNPHWLPNPHLPQTRSEVAIPIAIGEQVEGVLDVQQSVTAAFSQTDADLLLSIANQIAIALQNTKLYEQSQKRVAQAAHLNTITQKIQATATTSEALQVAVRELGRVVGAEQTIIHLAPNGPDAPADSKGLARSTDEIK